MNLIRASEAASILRVHRLTVWRWVNEGKLTAAMTIGKEKFFDRGYIEEVAKRNTTQKAA